MEDEVRGDNICRDVSLEKKNMLVKLSMLLLIRRTEEHKRSEGHDRLASIDRQAMAEEVILRKGIFVPFDIAWFVCLVSPFETEGLKIPIFTVDALLTKPSSYHNEIKHAKNQTPGNARSRRRSRG